QDYLVNPSRKTVDLTLAGLHELQRSGKPPGCDALDAGELRRLLSNAIAAATLYQAERDYLMDAESGVTIIDGPTGRLAVGRIWRDGMQQAIETKEGLAPSPVTSTIARCTVQSYFLRYQHLAGLTGTARTAQREFRQTYKLTVRRIPTHRPCLRRELPARVFATTADKLAAVVDDLRERQARGGAVLVGVPSVSDSEELSQVLAAHSVRHQVLNCREHRREAAIVAQAGQPGRVTIATNMAGRGTDIHVHADVLRCGGLHVMLTQMHASPRIDRQLEGRAARQGEPGSFQYFVSLEDRLLVDAGEALAIRASRTAQEGIELPGRWVRRFRAAQQRAEESQRRQRRALLKSEEQREKACLRMGLKPVLEAID
ncbi:MAG: translocase, partial [Planctomycetales bacterium]|nr:translocase [Planctomycetales bacterium]